MITKASINQSIKNYNVIGSNLNEPSGLFATVGKLQSLGLKSSDVVVFCLPHSFFESKKFLPIRSNKKIGFTSALIVKSFREFPFQTFNSIFLDNKIKDVMEIVSKRNLFTKSLTSHSKFIAESEVEKDSIYQYCSDIKKGPYDIKSLGFEKDYIDKIRAYLKENIEAEILFRFPASLRGVNEIDIDRLEYVKNVFMYINTIESSEYELENFYNQTYHLNSCGRELCTKKLAEELNEKIILKFN